MFPKYLGLAAAALFFWVLNTVGRHGGGQVLEAGGSFLWFLSLCAIFYLCGWLAGALTLVVFLVGLAILQAVTRAA